MHSAGTSHPKNLVDMLFSHFVSGIENVCQSLRACRAAYVLCDPICGFNGRDNSNTSKLSWNLPKQVEETNVDCLLMGSAAVRCARNGNKT